MISEVLGKYEEVFTQVFTIIRFNYWETIVQ